MSVEQLEYSELITRSWPELLRDLADATCSSAAIAISAGVFSTRTLLSSTSGSDVSSALADARERSSNFGQYFFETAPDAFAALEDWFQPKAGDAFSKFVETIQESGQTIAAGALVPAASDDPFGLLLLRSTAMNALEAETLAALNNFLPAIGRAIHFQQKAADQAASWTLQGLGSAGLPALLLDDDGAILATNELAEPLLSSVIRTRRNRISLADSRENRLLQKAISDIGRASEARSFAISPRPGHPPAVLHLLPLSTEVPEFLRRASKIAVVTGASYLKVPRRSVLSVMFNLTSSEAKVAQLLANAMAADDIAAKLQVGRETVRTHARSIYRKAGVHRQLDFVRLVSGVHGLPFLGNRRTL